MLLRTTLGALVALTLVPSAAHGAPACTRDGGVAVQQSASIVLVKRLARTPFAHPSPRARQTRWEACWRATGHRVVLGLDRYGTLDPPTVTIVGDRYVGWLQTETGEGGAGPHPMARMYDIPNRLRLHRDHTCESERNLQRRAPGAALAPHRAYGGGGMREAAFFPSGSMAYDCRGELWVARGAAGRFARVTLAPGAAFTGLEAAHGADGRGILRWREGDAVRELAEDAFPAPAQN